MKRPTTLLRRVLLNEGLQSSVATERDYQVIDNRYKHEGMSFLTITLPSLCDSLDQGLAFGRFALPDGFKAQKRGGKLPALLSGFFNRVFCKDGHLLDTPCIDSIRAIRQITRLFKKVELPCTAARQKAAYKRYVENDASISDTRQYPATICRVAGYLWSDLNVLGEQLYCSPGIFGSGATAERFAFNERHSIRTWPKRAENSFPVSYHGSHSEDDLDSFAGIEFVDEAGELPVRVVQVPKTLKTPRTISVEPSYMMLMQQSIAKPLMEYLENGSFPYRSIRFHDQRVNRELAYLGSLDGSLATIDLSDASDLVSNDLVGLIFRKVAPLFWNLIQDCRSMRAQMPDGSLINLKKFASMGSALCFPIEAMVFYTIALSAMVDRSGRRLSRQLLKELSAKVSVYGDDIIVPAEVASSVCDYLEASGLKVNRNKSFTTGFFRESCGGDYYRGNDVTPIYVRLWDFTGVSRDASYIESCVSLSNQLYLKGLWHASQYVRDSVESSLRKTLPRSRHPIGGLHWYSCMYNTRLRWDRERCGFKVKTYVGRPQRRNDPVQDIRAAMLRCFGSGYLQDSLRSHVVLNRTPRDSGGSWRSYPGSTQMVSFFGYIREQLAVPGPDSLLSGSERWSLHRLSSKLAEMEISTSERDRLMTSVKPYTLNTKYRWCPVPTGIPSWSNN